MSTDVQYVFFKQYLGHSCTEFNIVGNLIQESFIKCNNDCPNGYNSAEAYKCKLIFSLFIMLRIKAYSSLMLECSEIIFHLHYQILNSVYVSLFITRSNMLRTSQSTKCQSV